MILRPRAAKATTPEQTPNNAPNQKPKKTPKANANSKQKLSAKSTPVSKRKQTPSSTPISNTDSTANSSIMDLDTVSKPYSSDNILFPDNIQVHIDQNPIAQNYYTNSPLNSANQEDTNISVTAVQSPITPIEIIEYGAKSEESGSSSDFVPVKGPRRALRNTNKSSSVSSLSSNNNSTSRSLLPSPSEITLCDPVPKTPKILKRKVPQSKLKKTPIKSSKTSTPKNPKKTTPASNNKTSLPRSDSSSSLSIADFTPDESDEEYSPETKRRKLLVNDTSSSSSSELDIDAPIPDNTDTDELVTQKKKEIVAKKPRAKRNTKKDDPLKGMTRRERQSFNLIKYHPELTGIWDDLDQKKPIPPAKADHPDNMKINMLPFQLEGLNWMSKMEASEIKGGILADEMGMGKTIQTIALLLHTPLNKPTLVVAPTVALIQWNKEINNFAPHLSVYLYYGTNRSKSIKDLAEFDVVITTYAVLESVFRKQTFGFRRAGEMIKADSILHKVDWFRIVLDEAHNIKDRSCTTARAAFALKAEYRWCLSGTPLQNRVGELFSLIKYLRCEPFSLYFCTVCQCKSNSWNFTRESYKCLECDHSSHQHVCYWNFEILNPIQAQGTSTKLGMESFKKLRNLIDLIMLRRTKIERASDLGLPPRLVVVRRDRFSPDELDFYNSLFTDSKRTFETYASHGTVLNNYANIFELITKMRLAVNHPDLLTAKLQDSKADLLVCSICHCEPEDAIASKCKHTFCRVCAIQYLESYESNAPQCPTCFSVLTIDLTQPEIVQRQIGPLLNSTNNDGGQDTMISTPKTLVYKRSIVNRIDMSRWRSSTKIEALVEELQDIRRSNANIKSIVFSQYVNFLDLVQWRLNRAGFSVCRLDGRMSPVQRDAVINTFMTKPQYTVFLVSLKVMSINDHYSSLSSFD
ncbi:DNA repair protein RAD16 [Smittium culicis]|uniref:DNA repair protein RAD16 n=1 Tax=Smittium culicis TaxID=133412 RepID=A0A1R1XHE5_9FUNG|nr:DNA repair protein RAD16 [Smittium culicis]